MEELNGERVDMIEWSDDPIKLISTALQPAAISAVIIVNDKEELDEEGHRIKKRAAVFVEEAQRPMAIGRKGQNIRLATDLTSFELDMYNYEELPAFKAKLAELKGEEITVVELGGPDAEEKGESESEEAPEGGVGKKAVKASKAAKASESSEGDDESKEGDSEEPSPEQAPLPTGRQGSGGAEDGEDEGTEGTEGTDVEGVEEEKESEETNETEVIEKKKENE
jgi:hypothetical protein